MTRRILLRFLSSAFCVVELAALVELASLTCSVAYAQELATAAQRDLSATPQLTPADAQSPPAENQQSPTAPQPQVAPTNIAQPCIQPAPMVRLEDYDGPFRKVVGTFVGRFDRATAHLPHGQPFKPGTLLCTLPVKAKFVLFLEDSIDPGTFLGAAFNAGLDQAEDSDPSYGQGAKGYATRFGAELAGQASGRFFGDFLYPSIFSEDPRYYRLWHGSAGKRLLHAVEHSVVAHGDDGHEMFNYSQWFATASTVVLSNTYHPDNRRGFGPAAARFGYAFAGDIGFDILREFWPDISRKLKLPFRGEPATSLATTSPPLK